MKNIIIFAIITLLGFFVNPVSSYAQCTPNSYSNTTVLTPRSTSVPVYSWPCELLTPAQITACSTWVANTYPAASVIAPATRKRNCHSNAWIVTPDGVNKWMDNPMSYFYDGSYTYTELASFINNWLYVFDLPNNGGTVINYHSAIASPSGQTNTVKSKWGAYPLVQHARAYCPYTPGNYGPWYYNQNGQLVHDQGLSPVQWSFEYCPNTPNTCKAPGAFWLSNTNSNSTVLNLTRACNAIQYQLQYKLSGNSNWLVLANLTPPSGPHFLMAWTITGMTPNLCYNFRIKVINGTASVYSSTQTACATNFQGGTDERDANPQTDQQNEKFADMLALSLEAIVLTSTPESKNSVPITCTATTNGYAILANVSERSSFVVANSLGQIICSGKAEDGTVRCEVKNSGIYFLSIIDQEGNKCTQIIFVK